MLSTQKLSTGQIGLPATKKCRACHETKPLTDFHKDNNKKDKLTCECKVCRCAKQKVAHRKNPHLAILHQVKSRAKRKGWDFNLDEDYIRSIDRDVCPYLEIPIFWRKGFSTSNVRMADSKSIDRIDSAKGYVKGNIIVCSMRANMILSNATAAEMALITVNFHRILNDITTTTPD